MKVGGAVFIKGRGFNTEGVGLLGRGGVVFENGWRTLTASSTLLCVKTLCLERNVYVSV